MIIISMGAGLGNQMFEYSFYYHIKKKYPDQQVKVDTRYAFPNAHNGIEVFNIFNLSAPEASFTEVINLAGKYTLNGENSKRDCIMSKIIRKVHLFPPTLLTQSDFTAFEDKFFNLKDNQSYYLYGPFANYHYFNDVENEIKGLYVFPSFSDERNKSYKNTIVNCNSVSIHVRKGDYAKEGVELTSKEFYYKAIEIIERIIGNCQFFVFTDDETYARHLFPDEARFIIVKGNTGPKSYEDMHLMSLCNHNITANSTFSFWGAFLNRNKEKIVIAPDLPFTGCKYPFICDDWKVLTS